MSGHTKWADLKHKKDEKQYDFKKRKRKDLVNAMQIAVFSMTDAELDKKLRRELEEAIENVVKAHKDAAALAYTIEKG